MAASSPTNTTEDEHPRHRPCPIPLPVTLAAFQDTVAAVKSQVEQQYTRQREEFMDKTLGSTPQQRRRRTQAEADKDFMVLLKVNPVLAGSNPFKATWLPGSGDIPAFPPREVRMARENGVDPAVKPQEGLLLDDFMLANDRLLAMTEAEMASVPYMDAWLFKFALNRYFDFPSAAARFLKFRELIKKYGLSFNLKQDSTASNGMLNLNRRFMKYATATTGAKVPQIFSPNGGISEEYLSSSDEEKQEMRDACMECHSEIRAHPRAPILLLRPRYLDWSKTTIEEMRQFGFYACCSVIASDYFVQTHGGYVVNSALGATFKNFKKEIFDFGTELMYQCAPVKFRRIFFCNEGWFYNSVLFPLLKMALSAKMRQRIVVVHQDDYDEVIETCGSSQMYPETGGIFHHSAAQDPEGRHTMQDFMRNLSNQHPKAAGVHG